jgi:hypothetical protein
LAQQQQKQLAQQQKRLDFAAWKAQQDQQPQQWEPEEPRSRAAKLATASASQPLGPDLAAANTYSEGVVGQRAVQHLSQGSAGLMQPAPSSTAATKAKRRALKAKRKPAVAQGHEPAGAAAGGAAAAGAATAEPAAVTSHELILQVEAALAAFAATSSGSVAAVAAGQAKAGQSLLALGSGPVRLASSGDVCAWITPFCNELNRLMTMELAAGLQQRPFLYTHCSTDFPDGFEQQLLAVIRRAQLESAAGGVAAVSGVQVGQWQQGGCGLGEQLQQAAEDAEGAQLFSDQPQGLTNFHKAAVALLRMYIAQGVLAALHSSVPPAKILQHYVCGVTHVARILATLDRMLCLPPAAAEQGHLAAAAATFTLPAHNSATAPQRPPAQTPTVLTHSRAATVQAPAAAAAATAGDGQQAEQALLVAMESANTAAAVVLTAGQLQVAGGIHEQLPADDMFVVSTDAELQRLVKLHCRVSQNLVNLSPSIHKPHKPLGIR